MGKNINVSRRNFLKAFGFSTLMVGIGTALSGCDKLDDVKAGTSNDLEKVDNNGYTKTNETEYFEEGQHLICIVDTDAFANQNQKNLQIEIPEGYEMLSSSAWARYHDGLHTREKTYWVNNVPVIADLYVDKDGNTSCPYFGQVAELEKETSNTKTY